jgi:uroporphyrinogen-III synthase
LKVLVTRPEPGASATAHRLVSLRHEPILAPCLIITPRAADLPDQPAAIIMTSMQALPALPAGYHHIPVFCVGDATAGRLRESGFRSVESAGGNAQDLFRLITMRRLSGAHLLATGARQGMALARRLRAAGIDVVRRPVYSARPAAALPEPAVEALVSGAVGAAMFYSAETARAFTRIAPAGMAPIPALVLSPAVAQGLSGLNWAAIRVALAPTEADLLALLHD